MAAMIPVLANGRGSVTNESTLPASQLCIPGSALQLVRELFNIKYMSPTLRKAEIFLNGDKAFVFH